MTNTPEGMTAAEFDQELAALENELRGSRASFAVRALVVVEWARAHLKSKDHCDWCWALRHAPPDTDTGRASSRLLRFFPEAVVGRRPPGGERKGDGTETAGDGTETDDDIRPGRWCFVRFREDLKHEAYIHKVNGNRVRLRKYMQWAGQMKWTGLVTVDRSDILGCWDNDEPDYDNP